MFEQTLEEMTAIVTVEPGMFQTVTASNIGGLCGLFVHCGSRKYTFTEASDAINALDKALLSCPKYLYKRIRSTRMQFVYAFGPEMMERFPAPAEVAA